MKAHFPLYVFLHQFLLEYSYVVCHVYNVMLVSPMQQREPARHTRPLFFWIPSLSGRRSVLSRVPCAIQCVLISYLFIHGINSVYVFYVLTLCYTRHILEDPLK